VAPLRNRKSSVRPTDASAAPTTVLAVLRTNHHGAVTVLTFDRPEARNAFNHALYCAISDELDRARDDDTTNVVVLTGHGSAFCAGQDLVEMTAMARGDLVFAGGHGFTRLLESLESFDKPLLAAVNGPAAGIGLTMLLHCDIVLVAESARLRVPFAEMGVPPEAGSSALLPLRLGWQKASELLFTSGWMSADEAIASGLALRSTSDDRIVGDTIELATRIATHDGKAMRTTKRLMMDARGSISQDARVREETAFAELFRSTRGNTK
jgi:enoyl-CoA hydratase/carnithine racemase